MTVGAMRFGAFIAPIHRMQDHPTLAIERDMQLVELLDQLTYDEVWIGEHHSSGTEIIASPEVFIAAVAERTKHIFLGSGVSSLSYHQPFVLADRFIQLDHQARGRIMLGAGPGQLASDAYMMGIEPIDQRKMMIDSLECIVRLLDGDTVSVDAGWFRLRDARLQLKPYRGRKMEVAVAAVFTPSGPALAGRLGLSMLSLAASTPAGFDVLPEHWKIYEDEARKAGNQARRETWRVVVPIHVAASKEQAKLDVMEGALDLVNYFRTATGGMLPGFEGIDTPEQAFEAWTTKGLATTGVLQAGTPNDIIDYITKLQKQTGGMGTFLVNAHNAANPEATRRSYELFARDVIPHFQNLNTGREHSLSWISENAKGFLGSVVVAQSKSVSDYKENNGLKTTLTGVVDTPK